MRRKVVIKTKGQVEERWQELGKGAAHKRGNQRIAEPGNTNMMIGHGSKVGKANQSL